MALNLIDTKAVHEITISETVFKVRAMNARQRINANNIIANIMVKGDGNLMSETAYNALIDILDDRVAGIVDYPDKRATLEAMTEGDLIVLTAGIMKLSQLPEAEAKN